MLGRIKRRRHCRSTRLADALLDLQVLSAVLVRLPQQHAQLG
jgi:hypothetical protein